MEPFQCVTVIFESREKKKNNKNCLLCNDAVTMVTSKRFHHFRFNIFACFLSDLWTLKAHLLPDACPGWWTLWRPRVASCCVPGILHVFRLGRTWKRGSIQPETPKNKELSVEKQTVFTNDRMLSKNSHLWFASLLDINVLCINIRVDVLVCMDINQDIQLQLSRKRVELVFLITWNSFNCTNWHSRFYKRAEGQSFLAEASFLPPWLTGETDPC